MNNTNQYKFFYFPTILLIFALLTLSCSLFNDEDEPIKDPRTYDLTIDTIRYEGEWGYFYNLWGSSDNDVYLVGRNDLNGSSMYHFDGTDWSPILLRLHEGGNICCAFQLIDVWGFSENNIWAVGYDLLDDRDAEADTLPGWERSMVLHYDGMEWSKVDMPLGQALFRIGGAGSNNLFAGGGFGDLFHYDGIKWSKVDVPIPNDYLYSYWTWYSTITRSINDTEIYMFVTGWTEESYLLRYADNKLTVIDTILTSDLGDLWLSPEGTLYKTGPNISKFIGNQWQVIHEGDYHKLSGISGTSEENIFVVGQRPSGEGYGIGMILHYNGTDWYQYPDITNEWGDNKSIHVNKNSIFCSMQNNNKSISIIIRGE